LSACGVPGLLGFRDTLLASSWSQNAQASLEGDGNQTEAHPPLRARETPLENNGAPRNTSLLHIKGVRASFLIHNGWEDNSIFLYKQPHQEGEETSMVVLEPSVPWNLPEKDGGSRGLLVVWRGLDSPRSTLRHWSVLWSRRSWGPLPSEASAHRPSCSHSPISPGSARDRWPSELGPLQWPCSEREKGQMPFLTPSIP
jgi:hypothetical protein